MCSVAGKTIVPKHKSTICLNTWTLHKDSKTTGNKTKLPRWIIIPKHYHNHLLSFSWWFILVLVLLSKMADALAVWAFFQRLLITVKPFYNFSFIMTNGLINQTAKRANSHSSPIINMLCYVCRLPAQCCVSWRKTTVWKTTELSGSLKESPSFRRGIVENWKLL